MDTHREDVEVVLEQLHAAADPVERRKIAVFYKGADPSTQIIGVRMKHTFDIARANRDLGIEGVVALLASPFYEARMAAVSILDFKARMPRLTEEDRLGLYTTYLDNHDRIDNWDLVDRAAPHVIGRYLLHRSRRPLYVLAASADPWRRRTAVTATLYFCRFGTAADIDDVLGIAALVLDDEVELVAKGVGIALKYAADLDPVAHLDFLEARTSSMSSVTLRFASERLDEQTRRRLRSRRR